MKKTLLSLFTIAALVFGINAVNAANISIDDIDANTYIIGDRVYELNNYDFSIYDVVISANEYAQNHDGAVAPIYYLGEKDDGTKYIDKILGSIGNDGNVPYETKTVEEVYENGMLNVTAINNSEVHDIAKEEIEPKIISATEALNENNNLGFERVTYSNKSITFIVSDTTKSLSASAATVKDIFDDFMSEIDPNVEITYEVDGLTGNLRDLADNEEALFELARTVLRNISSDGKLLLSSIVGNSITVKLSFEQDGVTTHEEYTIRFELGDSAKVDQSVASVDNSITAVVEGLETSELGFEDVVYDEEANKLTFKVSDKSKDLIDSAASVILAFNDYVDSIPEGTTIEYTFKGTTYNLKQLKGDTATLRAIAQELLGTISSDGQYKLGSVVGNSLTQKLTFTVGGSSKTVQYIVEFVDILS